MGSPTSAKPTKTSQFGHSLPVKLMQERKPPGAERLDQKFPKCQRQGCVGCGTCRMPIDRLFLIGPCFVALTKQHVATAGMQKGLKMVGLQAQGLVVSRDRIGRFIARQMDIADRQWYLGHMR